MNKTALPRTVAACLTKTHKWLLVESLGADIFWSASDDVTFSVGTRQSLPTMLDLIQAEGHQWTLYALTEPTLPEADTQMALDLMFPFQGNAAICEKMTPREQLAELYKYLKKALDIVGSQGHLRGIDTLPDPEVPAYTLDWKLVNGHSPFLCTPKIKAAKILQNTGCFGIEGDQADYIWFNNAVLNLFPAKGYYHMLFGNGEQYGQYCTAAIDAFEDAALVFDTEIAALATYLQDPASNAGTNKLYRTIAAESDEYVDILLCDQPYQNPSIHSLTALGKKLIVINNRATLMPIADIDITKNATNTKRYLLQQHLTDALALFVNFGWGDL